MDDVIDIQLTVRSEMSSGVLSVLFLTESSVRAMNAFNREVVIPVLGRRPSSVRETIEFPLDGPNGPRETFRTHFKAMSKLFANGGLNVGQVIDTESRYHAACLMGLNSPTVDITNWKAGVVTEQQYNAALDEADVPEYWIYV